MIQFHKFPYFKSTHPNVDIIEPLFSGPPSPTNVAAVQNGPTSITVTWTPPSPLGDATGYTMSVVALPTATL